MRTVHQLLSLARRARADLRLADALAGYEEAAAICRREGDALLLAHALRHVGDVLAQLGKVVEARAKCQAALQIYRENPQSQALDVANAIRSCALLEEQLEGPAIARPLWLEARGLYASANVQPGVEECNFHLSGG